jgi:hypothetical protein
VAAARLPRTRRRPDATATCQHVCNDQLWDE